MSKAQDKPLLQETGGEVVEFSKELASDLFSQGAKDGLWAVKLGTRVVGVYAYTDALAAHRELELAAGTALTAGGAR